MIGYMAGAGYSGIGKGEGVTLIGGRAGYQSNDDAINKLQLVFRNATNTAGERKL